MEEVVTYRVVVVQQAVLRFQFLPYRHRRRCRGGVTTTTTTSSSSSPRFLSRTHNRPA